jgi:hypothetical protein
MDGDECGAVGVMIGTGNWSTGGKLPQCQFVHHKSRITDPGFRNRKPVTKCPSYGMAWNYTFMVRYLI